MAAPILIPCLVVLRDEFNRIAPNRDKGADGWIGDKAHQERQSDHNDDETGNVPIHDADNLHEVHALDITTELNESDLTMEKCIQFTLSRCRLDNSDPNNEPRLRYIIFNRRIWRAPLWRQETYSGTDPHTGHAHFSAEYVTALEADTSSWELEEIPVALTAADKVWITNTLNTIADTRVDDLLAVKIGDTANPNRTVGDLFRDLAKKRGYEVGDVKDTLNAKIPPDAPLNLWTAAAEKILAE